MNAHLEDRTGRRRSRRGLPTVITAALTLLLAAAGTGTAAGQSDPDLPPVVASGQIGAEVQAMVGTEGFDLKLNDGAPGEQLDVLGIPALTGSLTFRVEEPDPLDPLATPMSLTEFTMASDPATAPGAEQTDPPIDVIVQLTPGADTPLSTLRPLDQSGPVWEQTMFLDFTMTIENPPASLAEAAGTEQGAPLELQTREPVKLTAELKNFPPKGELYQLQDTIKLGAPDRPDKTTATIDKFEIKLSELLDPTGHARQP